MPSRLRTNKTARSPRKMGRLRRMDFSVLPPAVRGMSCRPCDSFRTCETRFLRCPAPGSGTRVGGRAIITTREIGRYPRSVSVGVRLLGFEHRAVARQLDLPEHLADEHLHLTEAVVVIIRLDGDGGS